MEEPRPAYKGDDPFAFVCYAHADERVVYPHMAWLQDRGVRLWYDDGISGGSVWRAQVGEAIERAAHVLYFLSSSSVASDHCNREINLALDTGTPVIPVYLEDVQLTADLKVGLARLHALRESAPRFRDQLLDAVSTTRAEPAASSSAGESSKRRWPFAMGLALLAAGLVAALYLTADRRVFEGSDGGILERPTVAVLPIENLTGDPAYDYLSLGLMDELIVSLQRFKSFPVVSRGAALALEHRDASVVTLAGQLKASYVVDASLRADRETLRVLATLSDAGGRQVWARRFDLGADLDALFPAVDEVAGAIAGAVRNSEVDRVATVARPPIAAWEHYMKALSVIVEWRPDQHQEAIAHARRATELDPQMAEAWWALGELEALQTMLDPPSAEDRAPRLEKLATYFRRAHEISAFQGAACGCLGMVLAALGRTDEALVLLEEALAANPLSSALRVDYGQTLLAIGRFDEARNMAESAFGMEPIGKDLGVAYMTQGVADLAQNDLEAARTNLHRALFAHANNELVLPTATLALYVLGDIESAERTYAELYRAFPGFDFENPFSELLARSIDQILAERRAAGAEVPSSWREIVATLAQEGAA